MTAKEKYELNPKKCESCNNNIPYEKKVNKYCGHSCSAKVTNVKRAKFNKQCLNCDNNIQGRGKKYCSHSCQKGYEFKQSFNEFMSGVNVNFNIKTIRRIMLELYGHQCTSCNNTEWMGKPIPLEIHHIDGDADNDTKDNLEQLCPNCHAITDNYKNRNKVSSRTNRKKYYIKK